MISRQLRVADDQASISTKAVAPYKLGLVVLSTDLNCERDFAALRMTQLTRSAHSTFDFDFFVNRISFENPITKSNLTAMLPKLSQCVDQILPGEALDVVIFNCTAASAMIGDKPIEEAIRKIQPNAIVITTASSAATQLHAIGVSRISVLAPYTQDISQAVVDYFERHDFRIESMGYLGIQDDRQIARLSDRQIIAAASECIDPKSQALFISCTGTPAVPILGRLAETIGRPCLSSNYCAFMQAMAALQKIHART